MKKLYKKLVFDEDGEATWPESVSLHESHQIEDFLSDEEYYLVDVGVGDSYCIFLNEKLHRYIMIEIS